MVVFLLTCGSFCCKRIESFGKENVEVCAVEGIVINALASCFSDRSVSHKTRCALEMGRHPMYARPRIVRAALPPAPNPRPPARFHGVGQGDLPLSIWSRFLAAGHKGYEKTCGGSSPGPHPVNKHWKPSRLGPAPPDARLNSVARLSLLAFDPRPLH